MLQVQPSRNNAGFVTAAEAFEKIKTTLPTIKAWERLDDGSVRILGTHVLKTRTNGTISFTLDGAPAHLPIVATSLWVRDTVNKQLGSYFEAYTPDPRAMRTIVDGFEKNKTLLRGLAKCTRDDIQIRIDPKRIPKDYSRDYIAEHLTLSACSIEKSSYSKRVSAYVQGYSRGATGLAKLMNSFLWEDIFDRNIARAAMLIYGREAGVDHYNEVAKEWTSIDDQGRDCGLSSLIKTHRAAFPLFEILSPHQDANELNTKLTIADVISLAPQNLRKVGLRPAFWRWLLQSSIPIIRAIREPLNQLFKAHRTLVTGVDTNEDLSSAFDTEYDARGHAEAKISNYCSFFNRLADFPPGTLPFSFMKMFSFASDRGLALIAPHLPALVAGAKAARRKNAVKIEAHQIRLVLDALVFTDQRGRNPLENIHNPSWNTLVQFQQEWHEEQDFEDDADLAYSWGRLLDQQSIGEIDVTELTNGHELRAEGRTMHHCVAGYAKRCASGKTRVFSLVSKKNEKIRSTLEISLAGNWAMAQHLSYCNTQPHKELIAVAKSVVRSANRVQQALRSDELPLAA